MWSDVVWSSRRIRAAKQLSSTSDCFRLRYRQSFTIRFMGEIWRGGRALNTYSLLTASSLSRLQLQLKVQVQAVFSISQNRNRVLLFQLDRQVRLNKKRILTQFGRKNSGC